MFLFLFSSYTICMQSMSYTHIRTVFSDNAEKGTGNKKLCETHMIIKTIFVNNRVIKMCRACSKYSDY